jgi:uncharacterized membrane protein
VASQRGTWPIGGAIASLAGIAATGVQIIERISLAANPHASLSCNISKLISCTHVLLSPQASVFGPIPNSAIGLLMFSVFLTAFAAAASRGSISRGFGRGVQFLMLFMLGFVTWFMWQTAYFIGALCIYCAVIATAAVFVNLAWWKVTHRRHGYESTLALGYWALLGAFVFYGLWT